MNENFKQSTFGEIIESEREMILKGADQYGIFFENALECNNLLNNFVKSIDDIDKFIFLAFLSQVKKHHTLALFSVVRRHHIQAGMNLRQVIEGASWAAYALGHKEEEKFCEKGNNDVMQVPDRLGKAKNKWLTDNYKDGSEMIKRLKDLINSSTAHSNIVYAFQNFQVRADPGFDIPFFDYPDDYKIKNDLWFVGNIALGLLDLFYGVNKDYKVFQCTDEYLTTFKKFMVQNNALKVDIMQSERFQKITSIT